MKRFLDVKGIIAMKVHHLGISQSERIVWLCEELDLSYELVRYERDPVTRMAPAEYKALHLFGTAPVIEDGELVLAESAAIIEYVARRYAKGRLIPGDDDPDFARYLFWFHFANGSLLPSIMMELTAMRFGVTPQPLTSGAPASRSDRALAATEEQLSHTPFIAGNAFTAADIMMLFPLTTMRNFWQRDLTPYPNIKTYLKRIGERPAYQRAMAKGDPDLPLRLD